MNTATLEQPRSITQVLRALGQSSDRDARARRRYVRRPVNVRVLIDGTTSGVGWALNLSVGGIRVMGDDTLVVGEMVKLRIEGDVDAVQLAGHGRVVWIMKCRDGYVSGIEFLELL